MTPSRTGPAGLGAESTSLTSKRLPSRSLKQKNRATELFRSSPIEAPRRVSSRRISSTRRGTPNAKQEAEVDHPDNWIQK